MSLKLPALTTIVDSLLPFQPQFSNLLNEQHFYQNAMLRAWTEKDAHPVTIAQLANYGKRLDKVKIIQSANFVRQELPIRLSLKVKEMQHLNYGITSNYHLNQVYQTYYHCFNAFRRATRVDSLEANDQFCRFLSNVLDDHQVVLPHLMMGALEVSILKSIPQEELDEFISSMIRSRISRRVIMEQHISLSKSFQAQDQDIIDRANNYVGTAFERCSAHNHLELCSENVLTYMQNNYPHLKMPELVVSGPDVKFQFLTAHLNYIFTEILRNAFKATVENFKVRHPGYTEKQLSELVPPPVVVHVSQTKTNVTFKFSDQGGGMSEERLAKIWSFGKSPALARVYLENFHRMPGLNLPERLPILDHQYWKNQTAEQKPHQPVGGMLDNLGNMESAEVPRSTLMSLAGRPFKYSLGLSLPMVKVYTSYWNGTLDMRSVDGYGSDVYLTLQKVVSTHERAQLDRA